MQFMLIILLGAIGSGLRYQLNSLAPFDTDSFPWMTLIINIFGCLLIGLFLTQASTLTINGISLRLPIVVGLLGGFTTYSGFAWEIYQLLDHKHLSTALIYIISSIILGIFAVWLGAQVGQHLNINN